MENVPMRKVLRQAKMAAKAVGLLLLEPVAGEYRLYVSAWRKDLAWRLYYGLDEHEVWPPERTRPKV
jgi:hypothetical protein